MQDLDGPIGIDMQLEDRRAFWAQGAFIVRAARIALDIDDFVVDSVDQRGATDRAVGTDARRDFCPLDAKLLCPCHYRAEIDAGTDQPAKRRSASCRN